MNVAALLLGLAAMVVGGLWYRISSRATGTTVIDRFVRISRWRGVIVAALGLFVFVSGLFGCD